MAENITANVVHPSVSASRKYYRRYNPNPKYNSNPNPEPKPDGSRPIPGYEGRYSVTRGGIIYSHLSRRVLKSYLVNGYPSLSLHTHGRDKMMSVHRLVALTFIPNPKQLPCVNHKNGKKYDPRASNLEWCSYADNMRHAVETDDMRKITVHNAQQIRLHYSM